jgi:hypothetical protein
MPIAVATVSASAVIPEAAADRLCLSERVVVSGVVALGRLSRKVTIRKLVERLSHQGRLGEGLALGFVAGHYSISSVLSMSGATSRSKCRCDLEYCGVGADSSIARDRASANRRICFL